VVVHTYNRVIHSIHCRKNVIFIGVYMAAIVLFLIGIAIFLTLPGSSSIIGKTM